MGKLQAGGTPPLRLGPTVGAVCAANGIRRASVPECGHVQVLPIGLKGWTGAKGADKLGQTGDETR